MAKFILFILLFNALYGPRLVAIDLMLFFVILTSGLFLINSIFFPKINLSKGIAVSFLILLLFSLLHYFYTDLAEFTLLDLIIKNILYFLSANFFIYWYGKLYYLDKFVILRHILYSTLINAVFVIIAFFSKPFQLFFSKILDYEKQLNWIETEHRIFDLSLGGGATGAFTFALVFIIGLALPKISRPYLYTLIMFAIAIAASFMGRTGLYFILFYAFLYILKDFYKIREMFGYFLFGLILLLFIFYNFDKINSSEYFLWLTQGVSGEENGTFLALKNMWFIPSDNLILGDGYFGRIPPNIIYSDIGYVRVIHAVGFLGLSILYGWLIYLLILSKSSFNNILIPSIKNLFTIVILMVLLMNLKEFHFASRGTTLIIFIVFLLSRKYFFINRKQVIR